MPYAHPSSSVGAEIRGHRGSKLGLASAFTYPTRPTCTDTGWWLIAAFVNFWVFVGYNVSLCYALPMQIHILTALFSFSYSLTHRAMFDGWGIMPNATLVSLSQTVGRMFLVKWVRYGPCDSMSRVPLLKLMILNVYSCPSQSNCIGPLPYFPHTVSYKAAVCSLQIAHWWLPERLDCCMSH